MHPLLQTMVLTVLVPAVIAGVVLLLAAWVPPGRERNALVGLGLAGAWCVGVWVTVRSPLWPPGQAADWQFYGVVAAGLLAGVTLLWRWPWRWQWLAGGVFLVGFFALLLQRILSGLWPGPGAWAWPLGLGVLALLNAASISRVGHSVQGAWTFVALTGFSVLLSAGLALGGSAALGHAAGILAAACGAMWLVAWAFRRQIGFGPVALVFVVAAGGLLSQGILLAACRPMIGLVLAFSWPLAAVAASALRHGAGVVRAGVIFACVVGPGLVVTIVLR